MRSLHFSVIFTPQRSFSTYTIPTVTISTYYKCIFKLLFVITYDYHPPYQSYNIGNFNLINDLSMNVDFLSFLQIKVIGCTYVWTVHLFSSIDVQTLLVFNTQATIIVLIQLCKYLKIWVTVVGCSLNRHLCTAKMNV